MKTTFTLLVAVLSVQFGVAQSAFVNGVPVSVVNSSTLTLSDSITGLGYVSNIASNSDGSILVGSTWTSTFLIDPATSLPTDSLQGFSSNSVYGNDPDEMFGVRSGTFYSINISTWAIDSISLPNTDRITRRPGADEVWVCADSTIHVVDISTGMSLATSFTTGSSPYDGSEVRFSADGATAIKMNWNSNTVAKIDADNKTVTTMLDMSFASNLSGVEVTADGNTAFISASNDNMLYKIDVNTMTLSDSVEMPRSPFGIYRHPSSGKMWVVGHFDDIIYIVNPSDLSIEDSIEVGSSPHIVVFMNTPTGIAEPMLSKASCYPNPTQNSFQMEGMETGDSWIIQDVLGRTVSSGKALHSNETIDISKLNKGTYMVSTKTSVGKIVKQ